MPIDVVDAVIFIVFAICMVYGWRTGLLRVCVALSAVIFALMCANTFYQGLGAWWEAAGGLVGPTYLEALAYLLLYLLSASFWLMVIRRVYPYTRLSASEVGSWVWSLDRFGGLLVGAVLGVLVAVSVVGAAELLVYHRWGGQPGARGVRDIVHAQVVESAVVRNVLGETPALAELVTYWVPGWRIAKEGNIRP